MRQQTVDVSTLRPLREDVLGPVAYSEAKSWCTARLETFRARRARQACVILGCEESTRIQTETGAYFCTAHAIGRDHDRSEATIRGQR